MKNVIVLILVLFPFIGFTQVQIGQDINGEIGDNSGFSISLSSDGNIVAISAPTNDNNGEDSGLVRIFEFNENNWIQIGQDINGEALEDLSGIHLSLSSDGSIVAIGASENNGNGVNSGHVRIYRNDNDNWVQIGQDIDGEASNDQSGFNISLSSNGSIIAIGAQTNDGINGVNSGHVRIFEFSGNNWVQIGQDINGEAVEDLFGISVSLSSDGNIVGIGAIDNDGNGVNSGHVRIFRNDNDNWVQIGQDINGEATGDRSGSSVSLSNDGSIIAIGAQTNDGINGVNSGHVRIFRNDNDNWVQIGQDIDGEATGDGSGGNVSLSSDGTIVSISGRINDGNGVNSGHVRIYQNVNGDWTQIGEDIDGEATNDRSGRSVSLTSDGSIVAIGANGNDDNGEDAGHVRVFDLSDKILSTQESTLTNFSILPNPANNTINISLSDSDSLERAIIYNSLSQKVLDFNTSSIDISSLTTGIYLLEVTSSQGKGIQKLLIE